jgi:hypothetical protein
MRLPLVVGGAAIAGALAVRNRVTTATLDYDADD